MLEYKEVKPLPQVCQDCREDDCYNCDYAGDRWELTEKSKLVLRQRCILKQIERLEIEKAEIDEKLSKL